MKPARSSSGYLAWFFGTVLALLLTTVALSVYFKPLAGDLTRIGRWSERDFGPTRPQPAVSIRANGPPNPGHQVLVLGDSFSHPNVWQSYLAESSKLETLSFQFKDVGCIDNWVNWIIEQGGSAAQTVIIQVAERSFVPLLRNTRTCMRSTPKVTESATKDARSTGLVLGVTLDASYIFQTAANTLLMRKQGGRISSGDVINVPLSTSELFSNRRANRLLYYAEDDNKKTWTQKDIDAAIENLKLIQGRLSSKDRRLVVAIVPDKSTVYRPYMLAEADKTGYPDIFFAIAMAGVNAVELLDSFRQHVGNKVDLYQPNDTHLSSLGYQLMASKIATQLKHADKNK